MRLLRCGPPMAPRLWPLLGLLLLGLLQLTAGSHFRYGTISWTPVGGVNPDQSFDVEFTFRAAFRRNYEWGKWFREQWQITNSATYPDPDDQLSWHGTENFWRTPSNCVPGQPGCFTCPPGSTFASNGAGCQNINPNFTPQETWFYVKFPYSVYADQSIVTECPTPFHCDYPGPGNQLPSDCGSANNAYVTNKNLCAPWSQVYGFFYGDGGADNVIMQLDTVDTTSNLITGNYVRGFSKWTKTYTPQTAPPTNYGGTGAPMYTAYFTGGDRIYECGVAWNNNPGVCPTELDYLLNNNAEGRFRLEVQVLVTGDGNRSPIVSQIPVLPVMHIEYPNYARFQIAAYDLDPQDNLALNFRFGDQTEMGGITRSKADGVFRSQARYGNFDCDSFMYNEDRDGNGQPDGCPNDRTPFQTPQTSLSFAPDAKVPGLVVWQTWKQDQQDEMLRMGLYNMVVMVDDDKVKVPLDFMLYLYPGNLHFCGGNCITNVAGIITFADSDGIYGQQKCTICGMGANNYTFCDPPPESSGREFDCGTSENGQVVPIPSACKDNELPLFIVTNDANKNPGVEKWIAALGLNEYNVPRITKYRGESFDFTVIAEDTDACTDLSIQTTGLPDGAILAPFTDMGVSSSGLGQKGSRDFHWGPDAPDVDNRPSLAQVCFYAFDNYLITATPFYCIQLAIKEREPAQEQVLIRFECKLVLLWHNSEHRFGVYDGTDRFWSNCTYESYMWHHAMVSIEEDGTGALNVDGQVVAEFSTEMYPNMCLNRPPSSPPPPAPSPPPPEAGGRR
eukprot:jgi/Chlat1/1267/Chrsp115S01666